MLFMIMVITVAGTFAIINFQRRVVVDSFAHEGLDNESGKLRSVTKLHSYE